MVISYKGRRFLSGRALADAMTRDINQKIERKIRQAASAAGASVRKTADGFEVKGDSRKLERFCDRLDR